MRLDVGAQGEKLYNEITEVMSDYSDGDRLYALGLLGAHTRQWLMRERNLTREQADQLIALTLSAAEKAWDRMSAIIPQ